MPGEGCGLASGLYSETLVIKPEERIGKRWGTELDEFPQTLSCSLVTSLTLCLLVGRIGLEPITR